MKNKRFVSPALTIGVVLTGTMIAFQNCTPTVQFSENSTQEAISRSASFFIAKGCQGDNSNFHFEMELASDERNLCEDHTELREKLEPGPICQDGPLVRPIEIANQGPRPCSEVSLCGVLPQVETKPSDSNKTIYKMSYQKLPIGCAGYLFISRNRSYEYLRIDVPVPECALCASTGEKTCGYCSVPPPPKMKCLVQDFKDVQDQPIPPFEMHDSAKQNTYKTKQVVRGDDTCKAFERLCDDGTLLGDSDAIYEGCNEIEPSPTPTATPTSTPTATPTPTATSTPTPTPTPTPAIDPHWDKVVSLMHFNENEGSTNFVDLKNNSFTVASGAPFVTTTNPSQIKFGSGALNLNGGSIRDENLVVNWRAAYTFEVWFYLLESAPEECGVFASSPLFVSSPVSGFLGWSLSFCGTSVLKYKQWWGNQNANSSFGGDLSPNQWHHLAIDAEPFTHALGSAIGFHMDGVKISTENSVAWNPMSTFDPGITIGDNLKMIIDDFRITSGISRYGASSPTLTIPTIEMPERGPAP